jgi:hypothetical protein
VRRLAISKKVRAALAATAIAIGVAVAPVPGVPPAEANDAMLPDLSVSVAGSDAVDAPGGIMKYPPGHPTELEFVMRNAGWTATYPYLNLLIPQKFTNVRVRDNGADTCVVKAPTAAIPGHYINCQAIDGIVNGEFPGILSRRNPRNIRVYATTPADAGQYAITAGIGTTKHPGSKTGNLAQMVIVESPLAAEVQQRPTLFVPPGAPDASGLQVQQRPGNCFLKKC